MLGLPGSDAPRLKHWSDEFSAVFGDHPSRVTPARYRQAAQSGRELTDYFRTALARTHTAPDGGLLAALARAEEEGDRLTEVDLLANANLLLAAGHETTTNLIGNGLLALLRHPDQLERLRHDPGLLPTAIEEFLRYDSPVQFMDRLAAEDLDLGGRPVRKGQSVYLMFGVANRDPAHFPDPDRLDVARSPNRHLAFGQGPHFCLGAPLARLEAQVAFGTLLRRFPNLRLGDGPLEYQENFQLRGLKSLPLLL
jgi:cytochrome P450